MDKLAKGQLHSIGPSQALLNVVIQLLINCTCMVMFALLMISFTMIILASFNVVIIGDLHLLWCTTDELELRMQGCFLFRYILGCLTSAYLCGPCILVGQTDVSVLVYSSIVHLGLLSSFCHLLSNSSSQLQFVCSAVSCSSGVIRHISYNLLCSSARTSNAMVCTDMFCAQYRYSIQMCITTKQAQLNFIT